MCGIVGFSSDRVTKHDLEQLSQVMIESRIRGKHASGIAWYDGNSIKSHVVPLPIDCMIETFSLHKTIYDNNKVSLIAHARYSTSDIRYNQPLVGNTIAIAHNGVITQIPFKSWKSIFGYQCKTENDSELLLHALEHGNDVFKAFPNSSISAVVLNANGQVSTMRNGIRPLWEGTIGNGRVIASTYDILNRANVKNIKKITPVNGVEFQTRGTEI